MSTPSRSEESFAETGLLRRSFFVELASFALATVGLPSVAYAQVDLRSVLPSLGDGRISSRFVRAGLDAQPTGRAYGLIDAPFTDVMRVLGRFGGYASLVPTVRHVQVESRAEGHARIHTAGRAPLLGSYDVRLDASIAGHRDGTHVIDLRTAQGVAPRMHIRLSLTSTPSQRRTVLAVELSFGMSGVPHGMARRAHTNAAVATIAAIRRRVRAVRAAGATPGPRFACPA